MKNPASDARIAEGETLCSSAIWADYGMIASRLAVEAHRDGHADDTGAFLKIADAYWAVAYDALRRRIDDITLHLLNKPVAELYKSTEALRLETTTLRLDGLRFLQETVLLVETCYIK